MTMNQIAALSVQIDAEKARDGEHDTSSDEQRPCQITWHYGTVGPVNHAEPDGPTGWDGIHGQPTANPSGICDACEAEWRADYPGRALPDFTEDEDEDEMKTRTRVTPSFGDPGKWQAQYFDKEKQLWSDIGDAQTDKAEAERREADYRRAIERGQPDGFDWVDDEGEGEDANP